MRLTALILLLTCSAANAAESTTRPAQSVVLVAPFTRIGPADGYTWIGEAVQQSLLADLSQNSAVRAIATTQPLSANDSARTTGIALANSATIAVSGSFQVTDSQVRLTGSVTDARSGGILGTLRITGPIREIPALQDVVCHQLRRAIAGPPPAATVASPSPPALDALVVKRPESVHEIPPAARRYYFTAPTACYPGWFSWSSPSNFYPACSSRGNGWRR